jgi:hypothetical protein
MNKNSKNKKLGRNPFEQTRPAKIQLEVSLKSGAKPEKMDPDPARQPTFPAVENNLIPAGFLFYWTDLWIGGFAEQWLFWMKLLGAKRQ